MGFANNCVPSLRNLLAAIVVFFASISAAVSAPQAASDGAEILEIGKRIYQEGVLSSGAEVIAMRMGQVPVKGAKAACINCHRRSGMGQVEGDIPVQPITGNFLFSERSDRRLATMDPRISKRFNQAHDPYTEASLATAIRTGVNNRGRPMNEVMPRFNLSDPDLQALIAYLRQLSQQWSPGVTETSIRFATVITPDVDPLRRKVMIDMLHTIFRQKNSSTVTSAHNRTRHHMVTAAEMILGTERSWDLDLWELQGEPHTWGAQLTALYRRQPVFALVSGASNSSWQPIHEFCDREGVPSWFPSVDVPGQNPSDYAFYFSGGVALEAAVLARHLLDTHGAAGRVIQVYRDDEVGRAAAQVLRKSLEGKSIAVVDRLVSADLPAQQALRNALVSINPKDVAMFWLRSDDVAALGAMKPLSGANYFSSILAKGESAPLSATWRPRSYLVYPYELPEKRAKNLDTFYAWTHLRKVPIVDLAMQSEIFFALNFMTDTLAEMLDNLHRDYLLERAETMLSVREGTKSEQETRDRVALGRPGDLVKKFGAVTMDEAYRIPITGQLGAEQKTRGTTLYPHLSLGPEQRFASKGAYIVKFVNDSGSQLAAKSALIVP